MEKDCKYWRNQISSAQGESKSYFNKAKKANEVYSADLDYNIFYSNVLTLEANLMPNMPKPDIQRRFLKKTESDNRHYNSFIVYCSISIGSILLFLWLRIGY